MCADSAFTVAGTRILPSPISGSLRLRSSLQYWWEARAIFRHLRLL